MMLALWKTVTFLRPRCRAYWKARSAMRVQPASVATFKLVTTPGTTSFSMPLYRPSVFSRTITTSTSSNRVGTPGSERTGRNAAYRLKR